MSKGASDAFVRLPLPVCVIAGLQDAMNGEAGGFQLYGRPVHRAHVVGVVVECKHYTEKVRFTGGSCLVGGARLCS
jgi:hypothetical protein